MRCSSCGIIKELHSNNPAGQPCLWRRDSIKAVCWALIFSSGRPLALFESDGVTPPVRPLKSSGCMFSSHPTLFFHHLQLFSSPANTPPVNNIFCCVKAVVTWVVFLSPAAEENHACNQSGDERNMKTHPNPPVFQVCLGCFSHI